MTTATTIELSRGGKNASFTLSELEKLYAQAQRQLQKCIDFNQEAIKVAKAEHGTIQYIHFPSTLIRTAKRSGNGYLYIHDGAHDAAQNNIIYICEDIDRARYYMERNDDFWARAKKGKIRKTDYLLALSSAISLDLPYLIATIVYRRLKDICTECGLSVAPTQMRKHRTTDKCREKSRLKKIAAAGLVLTQDYKVIRAIKTGIIKGEAVPIKWRWYAPTWAVQASQTFQQKKGYADMTFDDFITRMNPEDL